MIDQRILQALTHSDPDKRKKAVAYLAKSLDKDAIPHLARVYKTDADPEIRELAKRAAAYIQKNAPQTVSYDDDEAEEEPVYSRNRNLYQDDDDDDESEASIDDDIPLPSDLEVSAVAQERAKSFVEQALDWNVRGNNQKAIEMLRRAFRANPRLLYDTYTMGLASDITGMTQPEARRLLAPSNKDIQQFTPDRTSASDDAKLTPIQQLFAFCVFFGAIAVLIGFFALPWVDLGWIPVPEESIAQGLGSVGNLNDLQMLGVNPNNFNTLGGALGELQQILNRPEIRQAEALFGAGSEGQLVRNLIDGLRNIRTSSSGLDTMLYMIGSQDILRSFGFGTLIDAFTQAVSNPALLQSLGGTFGQPVDLGGLTSGNINEALALLKYAPQPVDFSVIAVPVAGSFAFLLGLLLLLSPSGLAWFLCILFGLAGVGACAYFYTTGIDKVFTLGVDGVNITESLTTAGIGVTNMTEFIGIGFWVTLGGVIAVAIAPFLGLIFAPAKR